METIDREPEPPRGEPSGWRARLRRAARGVASGARRAAIWTVPGRRVRRGAALGAAAAILAFLALDGAQFHSGFGWAADALAFAAFGVLVVLAGALAARIALALALTIARAVPLYLGWIGAGALVGGVALASWSGGAGIDTLLFVLLPLALLALLGGAIAFVTGRGFRSASAGRRAAGILCLSAALGVGVGYAVWLARPGTSEHLIDPIGAPSPAASADLAPLAALAELGDPGEPGPHRVARLTYGSGDDRRRPEFGSGADLTTEPVDGTPFLKGFVGWKADLRARYWGFDRKELPLNGRVWYPDDLGDSGQAPFPLVLVVHGNHNMGDDSDPGYDYLGELLASRGFVLVSVDENFLNGHQIPGPAGENDARGWLLLEHLKVWERWNEDPENPFHGRIDMDRIGLIGHSRGGEAVGHAAAFNRLPAWPDDATVRLDYGFAIRAVVAIAPSDGQYRPADQRTPLTDVAYLTLQGGHDGDVSAWSGDRQLHRVRFTRSDPRLFKAGVFLYRANHGQFNTTWGRFDSSPPRAWLLNVAPLMDPEDQRRAARTLIGGFLEATLHDRTGYREMFRDGLIARRGGGAARAWLPEGIYADRYRDGSFRPLADFEEDIDVTTGSAPGSVVRSAGLTTWREADVPLRGGSTRYDQGAYVGWRVDEEGGEGGGGPPALWAVSVPEGWQGTGVGPARLSLDLARAPEAPKKAKDEDGDDEQDEQDEPGDQDDAGQDDPDGGEGKGDDAKTEKAEPGSTPVDLTIELADRAGAVARLPLSRFGPELRVFPARFSKLDSIEESRYGEKPEPVFQTYSIPLADFAEAAPGFDPGSLAEVRLVFDRSPLGVIVIDDVGLAGD